MHLKEILDLMDIENYTLYGSDQFETLGLINANTNKKVCTFIDSKKFIENISENIALILVNKELKDIIHFPNICVVDEPRITFFMLHNFLNTNQEYRRESFKTKIGKNTEISPLAYIAPNNVIIGDNVVIEEFVSIKENTTIEDNVIIRSGTIVGGVGFEFKRSSIDILSVAHFGGVILKKHVEIQQNTCIDRAIYPWDDTVIGEYTKIDNLVHIAHGVKIDKRVLIVTLSCIAGRVHLEDDVWIGPGVSIVNGLTVGKGARVNIGAIVTRNVEPGESVSGNFAINHEKFIKHIKSIC